MLQHYFNIKIQLNIKYIYNNNRYILKMKKEVVVCLFVCLLSL